MEMRAIVKDWYSNDTANLCEQLFDFEVFQDLRPKATMVLRSQAKLEKQLISLLGEEISKTNDKGKY